MLRLRPSARPRTRLPVAVVYVIVAVLAGGGILAWDILTRPKPIDPTDPAVRAKAAAQSITGQPTVRRVEMGEDHVTVHATSRYYDSQASQEYNRQYLATEGRLIVQLILNDIPELPGAEVRLYSGRKVVAVVRGVSGQAYDEYTVTYDPSLEE